MIEGQPWVEKYRPSTLGGVVLDKTNKQILTRIIDTGSSPHLLLHGPPGTGKTTAAMNLVNEMHKRHGGGGRECLIHLNASDERGVEVVRQQIARFAGSIGLFNPGMKFVILDEVDYMTKCAQQRLRTLIQAPSKTNVTFCLICNYATRIDPSLREELVPLRFHSLPKDKIIELLKMVAASEDMEVTESCLESVRASHGSDVRSMINHLQAHQDVPGLMGCGTLQLWSRMQHAAKSRGGIQPDMLVCGSHEAGVSVSLCVRAIVNHAIRDGGNVVVDKPELMRLAAAVCRHHEADERVLAEYCARSLQAALSPQRAAR